MSVPNLISTTVPQTVIENVLTALAQVETALAPYLADNLSPEHVASLFKMGTQGEIFVKKGIDHAKQQPNLVPSFVNINEAEKDYNYYVALAGVQTALEKILLKVNLNRTEAGAEAIDAINDFYKNVQFAHNTGVANATPIFNDLKDRYQKNGRKVKTEPNDKQ